MDSSVDSFIRSLPPDYRCQPAMPKRILRFLLAQYVPESLWNIPKHGFNFPLQEFLSAEDFALVRRYLHKDYWRRQGLLSPAVVEDYGKRFMAGNRRLLFRVWALIVLAVWQDENL
jgi:asparagine synthase (glutamine-hydrolysing)